MNKANITPKKEKVFLYHLGEETEKGAVLKKILKNMGVAVKYIEETDLNQTIGYITGYKGFDKNWDKYSGEAPKEELLLMKEFSDTRMGELLSAFRREKAGQIHLKAVVTDSNRLWTLRQLIIELNKEKKQLEAQNNG